MGRRHLYTVTQRGRAEASEIRNKLIIIKKKKSATKDVAEQQTLHEKQK